MRQASSSRLSGPRRRSVGGHAARGRVDRFSSRSRPVELLTSELPANLAWLSAVPGLEGEDASLQLARLSATVGVSTFCWRMLKKTSTRLSHEA
jgi:hypothetical protein